MEETTKSTKLPATKNLEVESKIKLVGETIIGLASTIAAAYAITIKISDQIVNLFDKLSEN